MNKIQANKLAMYHAVRDCLAKLLEVPPTADAFPALAAKLATFNTLVDRIHASALTQETPLGGTLEQRERQLDDAFEATREVAGAVLSYALTQGLPELAVNAKVTRRQFTSLRRASRMRLAQRVHDAAASVVGQLADYGVTPAKLAALQAMIDAAETAVDVPRTATATKIVATSALVQLFRSVDEVLAQMDPLLLPLRRIDAQGYALYRVAREVVAHARTRTAESEPMPEADASTAHPAATPTPQQLAA